MQRVLEPEVMDTLEDAVEYDSMDFSEANESFAREAQLLCQGRHGARVLDLGIGTGDIAVRMLRGHPTMRIVGVDLAKHMLAAARSKAEAHGVSERLELVLADAKQSALGGPFDLVMSNSTAHHVPEPLHFFREISRLAGADAAVLVRDLFRPQTVHEAHKTVERLAGTDSARQKQLFFDSLCAALTLEEVWSLVERAGLSDCTLTQSSDRHWSLQRGLSVAQS